MNSAYKKIEPSLPITSEKVFKLDEWEVEHLDQYIFRFSKLQDAMNLLTTMKKTSMKPPKRLT